MLAPSSGVKYLASFEEIQILGSRILKLGLPFSLKCLQFPATTGRANLVGKEHCLAYLLP